MLTYQINPIVILSVFYTLLMYAKVCSSQKYGKDIIIIGGGSSGGGGGGGGHHHHGGGGGHQISN